MTIFLLDLFRVKQVGDNNSKNGLFSKLYKPKFSSANWTGNDVKHDILGPGGSWFKSSYNV